MEAQMIGIDRHRLGTDGVGVTTLVAFHGCPLRCRYCLNPQCFEKEGVWRAMSPEDVYEYVKTDHLYFLATGGGITFGGGEPAQQSKFVKAFCELREEPWHITLETSLNVPRHHLETLLPLVNEYFVDVKDMNPDIYEAYTGRKNTRVVDNLRFLAAQGVAEKVIVRLPLIPDFNTESDTRKSHRQLMEMGFTRFDKFKYVKRKTCREESRLATPLTNMQDQGEDQKPKPNKK